MLARLSGRDVALDAERGGDSERVELFATRPPDPEETVADAEEGERLRERLLEALDVLDARERFVVSARWLEEHPETLAALGRRLGVTRERVRQIEIRAKAKLRASCEV